MPDFRPLLKETSEIHDESKYYRDFEKLALDACKWAGDSRVSTLYWTLNVPDPALYARCADRTQSSYGKKDSGLTADKNITRRMWLLIDCDPRRVKGISSTDEEKTLAKEILDAVVEYLRSKGFSNPIVADSGNGYHALYRIDLPNDEPAKQLIEGCLKVLDARFSTDKVAIDTAVSNASRVFKVYGSVAGKGDSIPERPHRLARIISETGWDDPQELFPVTTKEIIETFVQEAFSIRSRIRFSGRQAMFR